MDARHSAEGYTQLHHTRNPRTKYPDLLEQAGGTHPDVNAALNRG